MLVDNMLRKMILSFLSIIFIILASVNCIAQAPLLDLGPKAIDNARDVDGAAYLWGGKGYDFNLARFATSASIKEDGYYYYDSESKSVKEDIGIDCAGLVLWAFNKAAGLTQFPKKGKECPVLEESANGQWGDNDRIEILSKYRVEKNNAIRSNPPSQSDLKPGYLLFLDTSAKGFGVIDHVGIYAGNNNVIDASMSKDNIIIRKPKGCKGTIIKTKGPKHSSDGKTWYKIRYEDGIEGWSFKEQFKLVSTNTGEIASSTGQSIETMEDVDVRYSPKKSEGSVSERTLDQWLNKYRTDFAGYGRVISLRQLKWNEDTVIPRSGEINDRSVAFRSRLINENGKKVRLQVELRRLDEYNGLFDYTKGGLKESDLVESGGVATAYAYGLIDGNYHWRARAVSEDGTASEWVNFSGVDVSKADFTVAGTLAAVEALLIGFPLSIVGEWTLHNRWDNYLDTTTIVFKEDHTLRTPGGTGKWEQDGNTISWKYDYGTKDEYEGTIGNIDLEGKMQNDDGLRGDWYADKVSLL